MSPYREFREVRKGAASLKLEAERAAGEGKRLLMASVHELERLADKMERGTVTSGKALDDAFARAHRALARHHHLRAAESWNKKETVRAGHALKAAAIHLEQGLTWIGQEGETDGAAVGTRTRRLAEKLIDGVGCAPAEVGAGIDAIGAAIEKLGQTVEPASGLED
ncbi:MAG: hypothetical protein ACE5IQ_13715 [Candidatus Methylomirabilales bacterium]